MPNLFDPIHIRAPNCPNRILIAPPTRVLCTADHVPANITAHYYAQRASAGMIISEAIGINRERLGWP